MEFKGLYLILFSPLIAISEQLYIETKILPWAKTCMGC